MSATENLTDEQKLDRAEKEIAEGYHELAQAVLNLVHTKSARKYYLQSEIYGRKQWFNEQLKQVKLAVKLEPDNETYTAKLAELNALKKQVKFTNKIKQKQMDGGASVDGKTVNGCCEICGLICEIFS